MSFTDELSPDCIAKAQSKLELTWHAIAKARAETDRIRTTVEHELAERKVVPNDASFVVFGSLARSEWTSQSDVDWTLLIDGPADPSHLHTARKISQALADLELKKPGREGVFGNLSFSHDLIHQIGGEGDSNSNLTQRILLLLESRAIGDSKAYERVVLAILDRYSEEDSHLYDTNNRRFKVPRFLLNDIVRFWRTMAVDYANKRRLRNNEGWALRNAKLRLSRKLLFVSGLLMCFSCPLAAISAKVDDLFGEETSVQPLIKHLSQFVERNPLDIIADFALRYAATETLREMFASYDEFLSLLDDRATRGHLDTLLYESSQTDETFGKIRRIGEKFQAAIENLFFHDNPDLAKLARRYGMF